jgi:Holliday junction resolvase
MANRNKTKGDRAERALATLLTETLGKPMRRMLGAGRKDDIGDIDGIDDTAIQVKHWTNITAAITEGIKQLTQQQTNKKAENGVLFIKHRTHGWLAVTTLEQWTRTEHERQHHTRMGDSLRETRLPSYPDQTT